MYQKPDFIKVSVKVKDVFANYQTTGCPMDELRQYTNPCTEDDPNYTYETYVSLGLAHQCYGTYNQ